MHDQRATRQSAGQSGIDAPAALVSSPNFHPLPDVAARQFINAVAVWEEHRRVARLLRSDDRRQDIELRQRLKSLRQALTEAERFNWAAKVGRVPTVVVSLLEALESAGLADHLVVEGDGALYAYEAAAGVRVSSQGTANGAGLLGDAVRRLSFITDLHPKAVPLLDVLRTVDKSFAAADESSGAAVNARGFQVEVRPEGADGSLKSPLEHLVVGATGRMSVMRAVAPEVYVAAKRAIALEICLEPPERDRMLSQADLVQQLVRHLRIGLL